MEEEKIRDLFSRFDPELSDDNLFLDRLSRNLKAIEELKCQNMKLRRDSRIAVCVASLVGFAVGVVLTLLLPHVGNFIEGMSGIMTVVGVVIPATMWQTLVWLVIGATSVITALNAYEITVARLSARK